MSRKDEVPVGGILTRKSGKKYEVRKGSYCSECAFIDKPDDWCWRMKCLPSERTDCNEVYYVRRKDLEEPK